MITHPEKVLFPDDGITKGDLAAYYEAVAPVMVPHLRGRPVTMERYPAGIARVGVDDVARVARKYIDRDKLAVLVVGKAADFDRPLSSLGSVTTIDVAIPPPGERRTPAP